MATIDRDERRSLVSWLAPLAVSAMVLTGAWAVAAYVDGSMRQGAPTEVQAPEWLSDLPGEVLAWTPIEEGSAVALAAVDEPDGRIGRFYRAGSAWSDEPNSAAIRLVEGAAYELKAFQGEGLVVIRRREEENGLSFSLIRGGAAVGAFSTNQPITSINWIQDPDNDVDALVLGAADGQVLFENLAGDGSTGIDAHNTWVRFIHVDSDSTPKRITSIAADGAIVEFQLVGATFSRDVTRRDPMFRLHDAPSAPRQGVDDLPDGEVFREPGCELCPEMVMLPSGTFTMGSPETEEGRFSSEGPQRDVSVQRFALGRTEITFDEWDMCAKEKYCREITDDEGWGQESRPVINVSWQDVTGVGVAEQGFLAWLNSKTEGTPYRLPSEAEWEYAARAGTQTAYPWGELAERSQANYGAEACCVGHAEGKDLWVNTAPVGSFPANAFGLHDMHGNVYEWTQDCWNETYDGAPIDRTASTSGDCSASVPRGGSWSISPPNLRSANRLRFPRDLRVNDVGFRVARMITP